ncbi:MAG: hypothetical protein WBM87_11340 [Woeseiaceae bacterium]
MKATDILRAVLYPLTEASVLMPMLVFWLLLLVAYWAGLFGLWLLVLVIPAIIRFQMIVLEARARRATPATPDLGFFNWFGNVWTLFPAPVAILLIWVTVVTASALGPAWAIVPVLFASVFFPAFVAVLAITQSPLQSLNPVAHLHLQRRAGRTLWMSTVYLLLLSWLAVEAATLHAALATAVWLLYSFSFFSLTGSLIAPHELLDDIAIPDPVEKAADVVETELVRDRTRVLNHAYGFISRDNRSGGFGHIFASIKDDPDPAAAWAWFLERMLSWEDQTAALIFAQHYLHDLLHYGESVRAAKLMMRCRLVDAQFRPLPEDLDAAIEAAKAVSNGELVAVLQRN